MVAKRKTVSKLAGASKVVTKATLQEEEVVEDIDTQMVAMEEENKELSQKEQVAARAKELKSIGAAGMKQLLESHGLPAGKKEDMIKSLLKHEAKERMAAQEQKAKIRAVVVKKKQELESQSIAELGKLCDSFGIKGLKSKEERVQRLLVHWQENDGVDKALVKIANDERQRELQSLDTTKLQKECLKTGVDPFVKEIMVERISKREYDAGVYAKPALIQDDAGAKGEKNIDMIDSLLANEAQRKKEKELRSQQEEALAQKRKAIKALSGDELKKGMKKKGLEASGKKEEMVEALFIAAVQDAAAVARQAELKTQSLQELKELLSRHGLETGSKEAMIKTLLTHEATQRQALQAFEAKVGEAALKRKAELESKTNAELKNLCATKGLPVGGGKDERIERIVEEIQKEGDLDQVVTRDLRNKRKEELMSMEKLAVVKLCEHAGVDPLVKDIMIERMMTHESEGGTAIAMADAEPPAKKARVSKK